MKKVTELFVGNYIFAFLASISAIIIASAWSKVATGEWLQYFLTIPRDVWIAIIVVFVCWMICIGVFRRIKRIREENAGPGFAVIRMPLYGWREIGEYTFKDVVWPIRRPVESRFFEESLTPEDIDIGVPPRCTRCRTELEQRKKFWGKYVWSCVGCGFTKKNHDSYYTESQRVEKLVRRDFREQLRRTDRE